MVVSICIFLMVLLLSLAPLGASSFHARPLEGRYRLSSPLLSLEVDVPSQTLSVGEMAISQGNWTVGTGLWSSHSAWRDLDDLVGLRWKMGGASLLTFSPLLDPRSPLLASVMYDAGTFAVSGFLWLANDRTHPGHTGTLSRLDWRDAKRGRGVRLLCRQGPTFGSLELLETPLTGLTGYADAGWQGSRLFLLVRYGNPSWPVYARVGWHEGPLHCSLLYAWGQKPLYSGDSWQVRRQYALSWDEGAFVLESRLWSISHRWAWTQVGCTWRRIPGGSLSCRYRFRRGKLASWQWVYSKGKMEVGWGSERLFVRLSPSAGGWTLQVDWTSAQALSLELSYVW